MIIEISNMSLNLIEADVRRLFTPFGEVALVQIIRDKWNNRPSGRAHVLMPVEKQARSAMAGLQGFMWGGKPMQISELPDS
jgi:RNA recognition motif-containing protein